MGGGRTPLFATKILYIYVLPLKFRSQFTISTPPFPKILDQPLITDRSWPNLGISRYSCLIINFYWHTEIFMENLNFLKLHKGQFWHRNLMVFIAHLNISITLWLQYSVSHYLYFKLVEILSWQGQMGSVFWYFRRMYYYIPTSEYVHRYHLGILKKEIKSCFGEYQMKNLM